MTTFRRITGASLEEYNNTPLSVVNDFIEINNIEKEIVKREQDKKLNAKP